MFSRICPSEMGGRRHHVTIRSPFSFPLSGEEGGGELFLFIFYEIDSPSFLLLLLPFLPRPFRCGDSHVDQSKRGRRRTRDIFWGVIMWEKERNGLLFVVFRYSGLARIFETRIKVFWGLSYPPYIYLYKNRDLRQSASLTT